MSSLYISTNGSAPSSSGVWRVSSINDYQYNYNAFIAGEDVNLDQVSVRTNTYDAGQSAPADFFKVGLYGPGVDSTTPGSLITYLSGPGSPVEGAYNAYTTTGPVGLTAGSQYWVGFTFSSDIGANNNTRVKISTTDGSSTYLGSGWSVGSRYTIRNTGSGTIVTRDSRPATFQLYASPVVCFFAGTLIKTPSGERVIDGIKIGDIVCTSLGNLPVKWVGKRTISRLGMSKENYRQYLPVRIESGALGEKLPRTDLLVSRKHGLKVDDRIVNACYLENGVNIYEDISCSSRHEVKYFHLEFDDEVLVVANGVEACSYVNVGNRRSFDNYPEFISLYGDADSSVRSLISESPRNQPLLDGHKKRVRRSW